MSACIADYDLPHFHPCTVDHAPLHRHLFPPDFIFGASSSAYQYEGAAYEDGRGMSIWDKFTKDFPEKIADHSDGSVAVDFYHRYKEDIQLMKEMGLDSFRFSISWPRILPTGKVSGGVNAAGVQFYNNLIDELIANGIKPTVTLYHWDLPQALQQEYSGFLSPLIVNEDFKNYADLCFELFGDRVKIWTTLNEPNLSTWFGYDLGTFAPGRCSDYKGKCPTGNSATEPYLVAHHHLLCHAAAIDVYRKKHQASQNGTIGLVLATDWNMPYDHTSASRRATARTTDFYVNWFLDPINFGHYPESMKNIVQERLPRFTAEQSKMLKKSYDYIGLNYYTSNFVHDSGLPTPVNKSFMTDKRATLTSISKTGEPIGEKTDLVWLYIYPEGIYDLINYVKHRYNNPPIIITENGMAESRNDSKPLEEALKDSQRVRYYEGHLSCLLEAVKEGANVKGYFAWSFLDDFEWGSGYTIRFGLHYIDYLNNLTRHKKDSIKWFEKFLKPESLPISEEVKTANLTTKEVKDEL
ncbi:hypothetical protein Ancab_006670 [Ancistrocladus abbreviatus]